jgi:phage shock protein A
MRLVHEILVRARLLMRGLLDPVFAPRTVEHAIEAHLARMDATLACCRTRIGKLRRAQLDLTEKVKRHRELSAKHVAMAQACAGRAEVEEARDHLLVRDKHDRLAAQLSRELAEFRAQADRLADAVRELEDEVDRTRRRKSLLLTERACADARVQMNDGSGARPELSEMLEQLEERTLHRQVRALLDSSPERLPLSGPNAPR